MRAVRRQEHLRSVRGHVRLLIRMSPSDRDHVHAFRVALGLFFPGILVLLSGHYEMLVYAVFGSFTGMYGRAEPYRLRLRHQAQAGAILVASVSTGVLLSELHAPPWALVAVAVCCATLISLLTDTLDLRPAGPFFGIFALGTTATIPAGRVPFDLAVGICLGTALFCLLVSRIGAAGTAPGARSTRDTNRRRPCAFDLMIHAARYALAISAAGTCGLLLGTEHANWAMVSAAVPLAVIDKANLLDPGIHDVVHRGIHRVLGTLTGLVATALLLAPDFGSTVLAVLVIVLLFPTELFMMRHYGIALGFFTPLIMLMTQLADPSDPLTMLIDRGIDTLIGVAAGIAMAVLVRRPKLRSSRDRSHLSTALRT